MAFEVLPVRLNDDLGGNGSSEDGNRWKLLQCVLEVESKHF